MNFKMTALGAIGVFASCGALPAAAQTVKSYRGVYVVLDPYSQSALQQLKSAAATPCPIQATADSGGSPFCGDVDGILLRTGWCNFEPDYVAQGPTWNSCHYILAYSKGAGSAAVRAWPWTGNEIATGCKQNFDTCDGSSPGTLATALSYIAAINSNRSKSALPPLKLSLGLEAGIWTPRTVTSSVGYVDVPHNRSGAAADTQCFRLPMAWKPSYLALYEGAVDQLLSFVTAHLPGVGTIQILKAAAIAGDDLEVEIPGRGEAMAVPGPDPAGTTQGPPMKCSSTVPGAQTWLSAYNNAPVQGENYAQAMENAFGSVIGHEAAALVQHGINALISVPTTGSNAFGDISCGISGNQSCRVVGGSQGNWSLYYLTAFVNDLFDGGLAQRAASAAFGSVMPGQSFAPQPAQISVNWTGLSPAPIVANQQVTCALNNTVSANDMTLTLDGLAQNIGGFGTTIGWQTATQQGGLCTAARHNAYMITLSNGVNEGAAFIEVEADAAFANLATCGADLAAASHALAVSTLSSCAY